MVDEAPALRWSIERRMEFLDACLFWAGQVNRAELVQRFNISVPQASGDFARYRELAPANLEYDTSKKTYVRASGFLPVYDPPSVDAVLKGLERIADGAVARRHPWIDDVPADRVFPPSHRNVEADALRRLLVAIREHLALRLTYQSFTSPEPSIRWIEPHALAHDADRWHVRAFCREHRDFRDFALSRISDVVGEGPARAPREADFGWSSEIDLRLAPNPQLPVGIRRSLELDHRMRRGVTLMRLRICFFYYVEQRFNLDMDCTALEPARCQLVLLNRDEVERAKSRAWERMRAALQEAGAD